MIYVRFFEVCFEVTKNCLNHVYKGACWIFTWWSEFKVVITFLGGVKISPIQHHFLQTSASASKIYVQKSISQPLCMPLEYFDLLYIFIPKWTMNVEFVT